MELIKIDEIEVRFTAGTLNGQKRMAFWNRAKGERFWQLFDMEYGLSYGEYSDDARRSLSGRGFVEYN